VVYYQPIVCWPITASAAMRRWFAGIIPERGLVARASLSHRRGERSDPSAGVGSARSLPQMAEWQFAESRRATAVISVNVFRPAVERSPAGGGCRVWRWPKAAFDTSPSPGDDGKLIMGDAEQTLDALNRLKRMNIRLEIDDFGTGYSSLITPEAALRHTEDRSLLRE